MMRQSKFKHCQRGIRPIILYAYKLVHGVIVPVVNWGIVFTVNDDKDVLKQYNLA